MWEWRHLPRPEWGLRVLLSAWFPGAQVRRKHWRVWGAQLPQRCHLRRPRQQLLLPMCTRLHRRHVSAKFFIIEHNKPFNYVTRRDLNLLYYLYSKFAGVNLTSTSANPTLVWTTAHALTCWLPSSALVTRTLLETDVKICERSLVRTDLALTKHIAKIFLVRYALQFQNTLIFF